MSDNDELCLALRELAGEMRAMRAELRASREKQVHTRRVKSTRNAHRMHDVPVSDIAAASAKRALAKLGL